MNLHFFILERQLMKKKIRSKEDSAWVVQIYEEHSVERKRFETETAAISWAANFAREVNSKAGSDFHDLSFADLMGRYLREVSVKLVKHPKNVQMIRFLSNATFESAGKLKFPIFQVKLINLCKKDFIDFRDLRLKEVGHGTFKRDWSRFYSAMEYAAGEWGWIHRNIMKGIRIPKEPEHRRRRVTYEEELAIRHHLINKQAALKTSSMQYFQVAIIFQLAIETALRASEILALKRDEVFIDDRYLKVTGVEPNARKTFSAIRSVPLTQFAMSLLSDALAYNWDSQFIFNIPQSKMNELFAKTCKELGIDNLHFHDARHEATWRLAQIYDILDLAKIVGHKDVQTLLIYYHPTIDELVSKMHK